MTKDAVLSVNSILCVLYIRAWKYMDGCADVRTSRGQSSTLYVFYCTLPYCLETVSIAELGVHHFG